MKTAKDITGFVAVPIDTSGMIHAELALYLSGINGHPHWVWGYVSTDSCAKSRNRLVRYALRTYPNLNRILFLDSDTVPVSYSAIDTLTETDVPIVTGMTPAFCEGRPIWNVCIDDEYLPYGPVPPKRFLVKRCGFSCIVLRADVFRVIEEPWFEATDEIEGDEAFCDKVVRLNIPIMCEPDVVCEHYKHGLGLRAMFERLAL